MMRRGFMLSQAISLEAQYRVACQQWKDCWQLTATRQGRNNSQHTWTRTRRNAPRCPERTDIAIMALWHQVRWVYGHVGYNRQPFWTPYKR